MGVAPHEFLTSASLVQHDRYEVRFHSEGHGNGWWHVWDLTLTRSIARCTNRHDATFLVQSLNRAARI